MTKAKFLAAQQCRLLTAWDEVKHRRHQASQAATCHMRITAADKNELEIRQQ